VEFRGFSARYAFPPCIIYSLYHLKKNKKEGEKRERVESNESNESNEKRLIPKLFIKEKEK
jgi:hypothetical protein